MGFSPAIILKVERTGYSLITKVFSLISAFGKLTIRRTSKFCPNYSARSVIPLVISALILFGEIEARCSIYDFIKPSKPGSFFAVDPDLTIRSMDPTADRRTWRIGETWGFPPFF